MRPYWWLVNNISCNGLVLSGKNYCLNECRPGSMTPSGVVRPKLFIVVCRNTKDFRHIAVEYNTILNKIWKDEISKQTMNARKTPRTSPVIYERGMWCFSWVIGRKITMRYRGRTVPLQMVVSSSHLEVSMYIRKGRVFHYSNVQMRRYTAHSRYLAVSFLQKT